MRVGIVLGTRPEIIKLAPVVEEVRERGIDHCIIHTNQHYDPELDARLFEEMGLPDPDVKLNVGSGAHGWQTGHMLEAIEVVIAARQVTHTIVQGDTNSGLAGALAAAKLMCPVAHVEAGLRSHDMRMPEEINRRLIDHMSHDLFPPTAAARDTLLSESVPGDVHEPFGNTIVDALLRHAPEWPVPLSEREESVLLTLHRPESVDDEQTLRAILSAVEEVAREHDLAVEFPVHPRTRKRLSEFRVSLPSRVSIARPQSFGETLRLQASARLVITDSGGLQEEACVLGTPCVVARTHTDRPEAIAVGAAVLAGVEGESIVAGSHRILGGSGNDWEQPFGDGSAGKRIVDRLTAREPAALLRT